MGMTVTKISPERYRGTSRPAPARRVARRRIHQKARAHLALRGAGQRMARGRTEASPKRPSVQRSLAEIIRRPRKKTRKAVRSRTRPRAKTKKGLGASRPASVVGRFLQLLGLMRATPRGSCLCEHSCRRLPADSRCAEHGATRAQWEMER